LQNTNLLILRSRLGVVSKDARCQGRFETSTRRLQQRLDLVRTKHMVPCPEIHSEVLLQLAPDLGK
jgi:hypothetical protein